MRDMHRWEELRPEEFLEEQARAPVVYWACGGVEDHGLQNALGLDPCKAYEICLRTAGETGGIVFPVVPFAPAGAPPLTRLQMRSGQYELFPPSLFVGVELCEQIYLELFQNMAALGFRLCVAFGGHGPAASLLARMAKDLGGSVGDMRLFTCGSTTFIKEELASDSAETGCPPRHGSKWETSINAALNAEYVDLSRIRSIDSSSIPSQLKGRSEAELADLERASAEWGEQLLGCIVERLSATVRGLLAKERGADGM